MEKQSLIICGKLFDGIKDELQENMEILVEGRKIKEVGKNLSRPKDVEIIDLSHLTVTPGMIDAHVHGNLMRWQEVDNILFHSEEMCIRDSLCQAALPYLVSDFFTPVVYAAADSILFQLSLYLSRIPMEFF